MDNIKAKNTTLSEQCQISIKISQKEENKRQRTPKGQSKTENPQKLTTNDTQDEEEEKHNAICVGHHYVQTKTNK